MSFPEGPVWILGVPFRFQFTDLPDPDDDSFAWRVYQDEGLFKIDDGMSEEYTRLVQFSCIVYRIMELTGRDFGDALAPFCRTLWGSFRDSPDALAYITGRNNQSPPALSAGGLQFHVDYVNHVRGASKNVHGETSFVRLCVQVRSGMDEAQTRYTLLHEWCHAVAHVSAVNLQNDEPFIRAVSYLLMDVFHANPDYMQALFN